jgi:hypothetical protein
MYPAAGTRLAVMGRLLDMMLWSSKRHKRERDQRKKEQEKKKKAKQRKRNQREKRDGDL